MKKWNIKNLPLLLTFKAIIDEGSLVGAAQSLDVTQSAVSKHLAQLREWLGDPLFVRTSSGMLPTPRALQLIEQVEKILHESGNLLAMQPQTPIEFDGVFRLGATDEVLQHITPKLLKRMRKETPNLRLTCLPLAKDYSIKELETGSIKLLIAVNWHSPENLKQKLLFRDEFVCVMHKDNPLAQNHNSINAYAEASHILVAPLGHDNSLIDYELAKHGKGRKVLMSVPNFSLLTPELFSENAITTLPRQVGVKLAENSDLMLMQPPLDFGEVNYFALWHERFDNDPKVKWVRHSLEQIYK